jgi:hypothetical protein
VGAAYTPVSIGLDGKIYTLNNGDMFVVGNRDSGVGGHSGPPSLTLISVLMVLTDQLNNAPNSELAQQLTLGGAAFSAAVTVVSCAGL